MKETGTSLISTEMEQTLLQTEISISENILTENSMEKEGFIGKMGCNMKENLRQV